MTNFTGTNGADILTGTTGKDILDGLKGADQMSGGGGDDLYYVDNAKDKVIEAANAGFDSVIASVNVTRLWDNVETLALTGNAISGTGNDLANVIAGNDKANVLDGGTNADVLAGGKSNDTYIVDDANDQIIELSGEGTDLVKASVTFTLANWVDNLTLTGSGDISAIGNGQDNVLTGNTGSNAFVGGAGNDTMKGGTGNDVYVVEDAGDKVVESAGQGTDTILSSIDFSLLKAANVEVLTLVGTAVEGIGNTLNNTINGNDKDNSINGGVGADVMKGGLGNDTYYVDNAKDSVIELAGQGTQDTVSAKVNVAKLWDEVEYLVLSGTAAINGTGNDLNNLIYGNSGANVLDGGIGADTLQGYAGNDVYIVDNVGDVVVESPVPGVDLVKSSITYTLGAYVENLTLTGTTDINGTGNGLANVLTGNDGANQLNGGLDKDAMNGGKGDDTYIVDQAGDKVIETLSAAKGGGNDLVKSYVDFSLATLANVERLTLLGAARDATGNALDNILTGNDFNNIINGGKGADQMAGGKSSDTYYIDNLGDVIIENADEGNDRVYSAIALTNAIANVENYIFNTAANLHFTANDADNSITAGTGKDAIDGGAGNDTIYGGTGADILVGGSGNDYLDGGAGNDDLTGGIGNDNYRIDNAKDVVHESANAGHDSVTSYVSLTLFDNVEDADLGGNAAINLTGNGLDNALSGNDAKNTIDGGIGKDEISGEAGNDLLMGGAGADTFLFDLNPKDFANEGHDAIKDFVKAEDMLDFEVDDVNNDGNYDMVDLLASISGVVDHGAGKDVDVKFDNGAIITFTGAGTGAVDAITDLVANAAQIHAA